MKQILKTTKPEADSFPAFTLHLNRERQLQYFA